MFKVLRRTVCTLMLHFVASSAMGQVATGTYPYGTFDTPGFDTINVGNLNVHFNIPILNKAGRGLPFSYNLAFDNSVWFPVGASGSQVWTPVQNFGWSVNTDAITGLLGFTAIPETEPVMVSGTPPIVQCAIVMRPFFTYVDPFGITHFFRIRTVQPITSGETCNTLAVETGTAEATDGSGYTLSISSFDVGMITTPQGKKIAVPNASGGTGTVTDTNGNQISTNGSGGFIDTTGNTVLTVAGSGTPSSPQTFTYKDTSGTSQEVKINYKDYTVQTHFGISGITEYGPMNTSLVSSIEFPDTSTYSFTYEATPAAGDCTPISGTFSTNCVTGRISSVTVPTGGEISYSYTGGNNGIESDGSTAGLTRTLAASAGSADSTWTYTRSITGTGTSTTAVVDGLNNNKTYTFVEASNQPAGSTAQYYETSRSIHQGAASGTPVLARNTCYNAASNPCSTASFTVPVSQIDTYETLNGGVTHGTTAIYNANGLQTTAEVYDFGTAPSRGPLLRKEVWTYGGSIAGLVTQDEVFDGSGNEAGNTTYAYDGFAPTTSSSSNVPQHVAVSGPRGNLTSETQFASSGTSYTSTFTYEDTGSMLTSTTPNGTTTLSYDSTFVYNTGVTLPTPSSGVALNLSESFDTTNTGLPLSSTDPNGQQTQIPIADYDSMLRPLEIEYPNTGLGVGQTSWSYALNPTTVTTTTLQSPNPSESSAVEYDGYGRPSRTEVANGQSPSGFYQQDTCYDANGNVAFKSYRYQSTGFGASKVCSGSGGDTFTHDVLGRLLSETRGDGETRTYVYTGRAKEFIDENSVSRISQTDGLGRLTIVCEIAPTNINTQNTGTPGSCGTDISGTGLTTTYSYALSTPTRTITQGVQTRTFVSDWLGRSTSVTEPESGTTTYGYAYNSTGLVVTRTRPRANQTNASTTTTTTTQYDSLGRVVGINYSDNLTPAKTYTYDIAGSASSWSNFSQANLKGRLSVASGSGAATAFSYDSMGQIAGLGECFPSQCGTPSDNKLLSYFYDLAGGIGTSVDGAGVKTNYGYTAAGEVNLITSSVSNSTHPGTLLSSVQNGPFGPISFTLGNGVSQINTYDALGRLNGSAVCPPGTTASIGCSGEIYGFSTTWKGKQLKGSSDTVEGSGLTYGYDNFNRLASMTNSSSQPLYTYTYDRYGNRWTQTPGSGIASGSGSSFNPTYIAGTNQITGMGYIYDAAGNLMTDGTNTYTYDADGNLIKQVNSSVTLQYTYNALNQQVVQSFPALSSPVTTNQVFDRSGNLDTLWLVGSGQIMGRANWGSKAIETYAVSSNMAFFDHRDWVGTRRAITNATGTVTDVRESLPFGDDAANVSGGQDNTFDGFTGLWNGATNNTNHAQFREYWNIAGRFLQPDPYSGSYRLGNPQSFNRYAYVSNNPLASVDPLGLMDVCYVTTDDDGNQIYNCYDDNEGEGGGGSGPGSGTDCDSNYTVCVPGGDPDCNSDSFACLPTGSQNCPSCVIGTGPGAPRSPQAPNNGPSYSRQDVCAASAVLNKGGATFLDALGIIPGEGNLLAGVQVGAGLISAGISLFGENPTDAAFSGGGLGLSAADLSGTAKISASVFGKSLKVIPVAGNILSGIATFRDIFGNDGIQAYYNDCLAGKN